MANLPKAGQLPDAVVGPSREALLQAVERASPTGLAGVDANGRQSYVSAAFCAMVGWSAEELLGLSAPFVYWPPEEYLTNHAAFARAVQGSAPPGEFELRLMRKGGQRFIAQVVVSPLEESGATVGWLALVTERTDGDTPGALLGAQREREALLERTIRAEAVAANQEALRISDEILKQVPDGVVQTDLAGKILRWSGGAERIFGYSAAQAVGQPVSFLHRPALREQLTQQILGALQQKGSFFGEIPCVGAAGRDLIIEAAAQTIDDAQGKASALVAVYRDVTDRKRVEAERELVEKERLFQDRVRDSEQRFRTLAESTNNIVWQTDATGAHPEPSPSWQAFTGQSEETWTRGHGWDAIHPEDIPTLAATWSAAVADRTAFRTEYRLRRADGVYVPMVSRAAPVLNADGSIREWIGTNVDISARLQLLESERAARQEAEAARQRMALLDSITNGLAGELEGTVPMVQRLVRLVVPCLADWCLVYVPNRDRSIEAVAIAHADPEKISAARQMLRRFPLDPDLAWGVPEVLRSGRSELAMDITDDMLRAASRDPEQMQLMQNSGMRSHIAVPLKAHGKIIGCLTVTQAESGRRFSADDLALVEEIGVRAALTLEQVRLYQEMRAARAEAESANRSKDVFLAMLGHELRNPLSPILTALELMRLQGGDGFIKERSIIERQVKHLVRLVDDLLDVSRITRGKIELTHEPIEIAEVIARAIEIASPLLEQQSHYLSVLVPRRGLSVLGDGARLAQVFSNLITNAAKYSKAGSQIRITGKREGAEVVVYVKDSGEGIDAQLLPYVFDLFAQGERTIDRSQGGLGIGLTIVRSLVALHAGTVSARSEGKGLGSEFQVRLPALEPVAGATAAAAALALQAAPQTRCLRVLVVDDNVDAAQLLYEALGMMGYQACIAHDGPSGLLAAVEFKPDVAFLDIGLPVMDGYELARRLREWSRTVHLIAITGYGQDSDRRRSREAGFEQHLVKPLDLKRFRLILDELEQEKRSGQ